MKYVSLSLLSLWARHIGLDSNENDLDVDLVRQIVVMFVTKYSQQDCSSPTCGFAWLQAVHHINEIENLDCDDELFWADCFFFL